MPVLNIQEVRTLGSYAKVIAQNVDQMKWYRGVSHANYELIPSLYRHPVIDDPHDLLALESKLITRFKERAQPMVDRQLPSDRLEMLFLMQHHGMPTRLLDWSENAFTALFFALCEAEKDERGMFTGSSCVWILRPVPWNKAVQSHINYSGEPFSVGDSRLTNGYVEVGDGAALMQKPVAVYGVHNSPRIVSQRGVFTLFGSSNAAMERVYAMGEFEQDALMKIEIRGAYQGALFQELMSAGILDSSVYPDLDGLARELRRANGYRV